MKTTFITRHVNTNVYDWRTGQFHPVSRTITIQIDTYPDGMQIAHAVGLK